MKSPVPLLDLELLALQRERISLDVAQDRFQAHDPGQAGRQYDRQGQPADCRADTADQSQTAWARIEAWEAAAGRMAEQADRIELKCPCRVVCCGPVHRRERPGDLVVQVQAVA